MMKIRPRTMLAAVALSVAASSPWAAEGPITKEQAIEMALKAHPGTVTKAYQETNKGVEVWEVKIKGDDGNNWEVFYRLDNGELFKESKG